MSNNQKTKVQSVERALSILEVLSDNPHGITLTELSEATQLHKSTILRLLGTLIDKSYAFKEQHSNRYVLSYKMFELGSRKINKIDVANAAKRHINSLMKNVGEVVHLAVRDGVDIVYIDKVEANNTIRMASSIGKRRPMYCTSVGKAIMAHLTADEVSSIWEDTNIVKLTKHTITDFDEFISELDLIRMNGFAVDNEENELGVRCLGAPILDHSGNVIAAISVSGPVSRVNDSTMSKISTELMSCSNLISKDLGYPQHV